MTMRSTRPLPWPTPRPAASCRDRHRRACAEKIVGPQPRVLLRRQPGAEGHQPAALRQQGDRLHRPVGLRQVDPAARPEPDVRPLSRASAPPARCCSTARTSCDAEPGPQPAARAHRHGVPEADAVPDDDLRQHRLRHPALREAAAAPRWTTASRRRCAAPPCGTRSRTSSTPAASACRAASSSACASPAPSR